MSPHHLTPKRLSTSLLATLLLAALIGAAPAAAQTIALEGGTVHPVTAEPFVGTVVIEDGDIVAAGADVTVPAGAERVDASGLHVYPGFFDALSQIGLVEVNAVAATVDSTEMGSFNPHLVAATAIHPASEVIPVTRAVGITQALVAPRADQSGVIVGQASAVTLDGWTIEQMAIEPRAAMVVAWPAIQTRSFDFATFSVRETPFSEAKEKAEEAQNALRDWLDAARHYARGTAAGSPRVERNLELEALGPVLAGDQPLIIMADAKRDIEAAIAFAEKEDLEIIIAGGRDAWKLADQLAEKSIPVILGSVESLPNEDDDAYDLPYSTAARLAAAGVTVAFGSGAGGGFGPGGPHGARTLVFEAGMATAYGLDAGAALAAMTINPARMLGLEDRLGSIEPGKLANLVVCDGDPFEIASEVRYVFIHGRAVDLGNKHLALYERYRSRPPAAGAGSP